MNGYQVGKILLDFQRFVEGNPNYSSLVTRAFGLDNELELEHKNLGDLCKYLTDFFNYIDIYSFPNELWIYQTRNSILNEIEYIKVKLIDFTDLMERIKKLKSDLNLVPKTEVYTYTSEDDQVRQDYLLLKESLKTCNEEHRHIMSQIDERTKVLNEIETTQVFSRQPSISDSIASENSVAKCTLLSAKLNEYRNINDDLEEKINESLANKTLNNEKGTYFLFIDGHERPKLSIQNVEIYQLKVEKKKQRFKREKKNLLFNESFEILTIDKPLKIFVAIFEDYEAIECDIKKLQEKFKPGTELFLFTSSKNRDKIRITVRLNSLKFRTNICESKEIQSSVVNAINKLSGEATNNNKIESLLFEKSLNENKTHIIDKIVTKEQQAQEEERNDQDTTDSTHLKEIDIFKEKINAELEILEDKKKYLADKIENYNLKLSGLEGIVNEIEYNRQKKLDLIHQTDPEMYTFEQRLVDILAYLEMLSTRRHAYLNGLNEIGQFIHNSQYQNITTVRQVLRNKGKFRDIIDFLKKY